MATIFQGSYLVSMRSSIPLQVQPQAFGGFGVISWGQCLYYGKRYSLTKTLLCVGTFYAFFGGFEAGSVFALWAGERRGITWPIQMYGWITSALLVLGLLPQYWEIYKHKEVVGISLLFMLVDIFGGVFSGASLFFRNEFDSTAFVQYMLVVVLDGVVVLLAFILNPIAKRRRARAAALADAENSAGHEIMEVAERDLAREVAGSDTRVGSFRDDTDSDNDNKLPRTDSYARTVTLTAPQTPLDKEFSDDTLVVSAKHEEKL